MELDDHVINELEPTCLVKVYARNSERVEEGKSVHFNLAMKMKACAPL